MVENVPRHEPFSTALVFEPKHVSAANCIKIQEKTRRTDGQTNWNQFRNLFWIDRWVMKGASISTSFGCGIHSYTNLICGCTVYNVGYKSYSKPNWPKRTFWIYLYFSHKVNEKIYVNDCCACQIIYEINSIRFWLLFYVKTLKFWMFTNTLLCLSLS